MSTSSENNALSLKCVVTGGAGFIGSHLTDLLLQQGHVVIVIDSLLSGRMKNLTLAESNPKFRFVQADIRDSQALLPHFEGVDWVFHLAGLADIVPSIEMPADYYSTNVTGTFNVLECARQCSVKRFVYAASSSSYGIPDHYPTPETAPIRPQYPYALTKYMGEELVLHWAHVYNLPAVSLRLFNVYGLRSRTSGTYGAVFGVFLAQLLNKRPLTVVGDGTQTRDFTYVTDVARAFLAAAQSQEQGEAINVGSGGHYSVNRLVELIGGDVTHIPRRPGEPDCTYADVSKITRLLNWRAEIPLEQGVNAMLESLEDWRDAPVWDPSSISGATKSWFRYLGKKVDQ
jgi:UDP-glucose 4-epimerase